MPNMDGVSMWLQNLAIMKTRESVEPLKDIGMLQGTKFKLSEWMQQLQGAKSKNPQTMAYIQQMIGYIGEQMANIDQEIGFRTVRTQNLQKLAGNVEQFAQSLGRGGN